MGRYSIFLPHTNLINLTLNSECGLLLRVTRYNNQFTRIHWMLVPNHLYAKKSTAFPQNIKRKKIEDHLMFNVLERTQSSMYKFTG